MANTPTLAGRDTDGITVHAGFPNPAAERAENNLSLDRLLIRHPSSTYLFRVCGNSGEERGIFDGDLALIDRAPTPGPNDLVIAWNETDFILTPLNRLPAGVEPWGTVKAIIHEFSHEKTDFRTN